jgi:hypothetical protein
MQAQPKNRLTVLSASNARQSLLFRATTPESGQRGLASSTYTAASHSFLGLRPTPEVRQLPRLANLAVATNCNQGVNEVSIIVSPTKATSTQSATNYLYGAYMPYRSSQETGYVIKVAKVELRTSLADTSKPPPSPAAIIVEPPLTFSLPSSQFFKCRNELPDTSPFDSVLGDPVLASNPDPSGFHPNRVWLAGVTHQYSKDKNQITVWHYDPPTDADAGSISFKVTATVGINNKVAGDAEHYFDDKPAIAVSQFTGTHGHLYVAYLKSNILSNSGYKDSIQFCSIRADTGDKVTECDPKTIYTTSNISSTRPEDRRNAPMGFRLDVDSTDGTIYLSWIDLQASTIHVMRSWDDSGKQCVEGTGPDSEQCWKQTSAPIGDPVSHNGAIVSATSGSEICRNANDKGNTCLYASSFLSSSLSTGTLPHPLVFVYHTRLDHGGVASLGSELMVRTFNTGAFERTNPSTGFGDPLRVSELPLTHDQWHGAVACGTDRTCTVVYYDSDPADFGPSGNLVPQYRVYARRLKDDGNPIPPIPNHPALDEASIPLVTEPSDPAVFYLRGMQYQDIFERNGVWYTASITTTGHVGDLNVTSDVVVSAITPCRELGGRTIHPSHRNAALPSPRVPVVTDQPGREYTLSVVLDLESGETAVWSSTNPEDQLGDGPSVNVAPRITTTYTALISNGCTSTQATLTITVTQTSGCAPPAVSGVAYGGEIFGGDSVQFMLVHGEPGSGETYAYQWYRGSNDQPVGVNSDRYTATTTTFETYYCVVTKTCAGGGTSSTTSTRGYIWQSGSCDFPPLQISQSAEDTAVDGYVTFMAFDDWPDLAFQWYMGESGDTSHPVQGDYRAPDRLTVYTPANRPHLYWVRVSLPCGAFKDSATLTFRKNGCSAIVFDPQPQPAQVAAGQSVSLSANAPSANPPVSSYEWFKLAGATPVALVPAQTGQTYNFLAEKSGRYLLRASNHCSGEPVTETVDSQIATVRVSSCPSISNIVTTQTPSVAWIKENDPVTLHVTADHQGATLHYHWYQGDLGDESLSLPGGAASYPIQTIADSTNFWVRLGFDDSGCTADSATIHVNVCHPPHPTGAQSPSDQVAVPNSTVKLSYLVTGTNVTYRWYVGQPPGPGVPEDLSRPIGNSSSVIRVAVGTDSMTFWVRATAQCGEYIDSPAIQVSVRPQIRLQPFAAQDPVMPGLTTTLTADSGNTGVSLRWYQIKANGVLEPFGTLTLTVTTPQIIADAQFFLRISSGSAYVDSDIVTVHVCEPILVQWGGGTATNVGYGDHFSLVIVPPADGSEIEYYQGVSGDVENSTLLRRSPISGYDANPITQTTSYWVRVVKGNCWGDSITRTVRVCLPAITQSPQSDLLVSGQTKTLFVTASPATATYQWYTGAKSDIAAPITGATAASYPAHPSVTTSYWVRVDGGCGLTADSEAATLTICQSPAIQSTAVNSNIGTSWSITQGQTANVSVIATGTNLTYQWYSGASGNTSSPVNGATAALMTATPNDTTSYWVRVTGACGTAQDSPTITVHICAIISQQPSAAPDHVVSGATTTLTAAGGAGGATLQWYKGETGDTSNPFGTQTLSVTTPPITVDTKFWLRMTSGTCNTDSSTVTVYVCALPEVSWTTQPPGSIASGTTFTLRIAAPAEGSEINWYQGVSGDVAHSTLLRTSYVGTAYDTPVLTQSSTFWVRIVNGSCWRDSTTFSVNVCIPVISQSPASDLINSGQSRTLSVVATPGTATYQWYTGAQGNTSNPINGATAASYIASPSITTSYWVRVSGCGAPADSAAAILTVCQPPAVQSTAINSNMGTAGSIAQGQNANCSVIATGTNLTYQWYSGASGNTSSPVNGATAALMTATPQNTTSYWVRVTGSCGSANGATMTVSVCATPSITTQPQNVTIFSGATATLSVAASEATSSTVTYQWYRGASGDASLPVGTGTSFQTPALTSPASYWVRASCGVCNPADSQTATVSICAIPSTLPAPADSYIAIGQTATLATITGSGNTYQWYTGASGNTAQFAGYTSASFSISPAVTTSYWCRVQNGTCVTNTPSGTVYVCVPTITQQPQSIMINPGASTTLSVAANTPGLTYQWYTGASGTTTSPLAGQTGSSLTVTPASATSYWVRVMGNCSRSVDSAAATVSICQVPSVTAPVPTQSIVRGQTITIYVNASGTNLTYQWYIGPAGNISASYPTGSATSSIPVSPQDTTAYWVRVTGTCGAVNSVAITVNVCAPPVITSQPQSVTVFSGGTATLSVASSEATVTPVTYQWYRGVSGDASTPVGTGTSFVTPPLTADTNYWVRLACGVCSPVDSQTATVSMCMYPATLASPGNLNIAIGQTAHLATITGSGNTYQWYVGASGNTSQFYMAGPSAIDVAPSVTTSYWCRVQNGTCVSSTQTGTVNVCIPAFTQQPASVTIPSGNSTTLTSSANTAGVTYRWYTGAAGNTAAPVSGGTTASITVSPSATTSYWVRATGSCGATTDSVAATVTICQAPVITTQPSNSNSVGWNGIAYLGVAASGSNLTYQWYFGESGDTSHPVNGATGSNLSLSLQNTVRFWVRVSGQCGAVNSVAVWGSVYPRITTQPEPSINAGYNSTASTTLSADGAYMHYAWKWGNSTPVPGAPDSPTLITPSLTSDTSVYCVITSGIASVNSYETSLTLCYDGPNITSINKGYGYMYVTITGYAYDATWYQGVRGDISHVVASGTGFYPSGPGQYWCRVFSSSTGTGPTCYTDSTALTFP